MTEPKKILDELLGYTEKAKFTGTQTRPDGVTEEVTVEDSIVNASIPVPGDLDNARFISGKRTEQHRSIDYTPRSIGGGVMRTMEKHTWTIETPISPSKKV